MDLVTGLGLAIPAGLNAYIPLLVVAAAQRLGLLSLPEPYSLLGEWWAIVLIAVLLAIEIVADKVPAVDTVNDGIQTFVRPAAGGLLAAASVAGSDINPILAVIAGVLVAGGVHAAKATARPVANAATGGAAAPAVSTIEDAAAFVMSVMALVVPVLIVVSAIGVVVLIWWRRRRARAGT